jgi:hypothetical protein
MVDADWITKGATLLSADWKAFDGEIVGLVLVLGAVLAPVYLTLQAWFVMRGPAAGVSQRLFRWPGSSSLRVSISGRRSISLIRSRL